MKALSVRAPWWWFILYGGKDIENRDWPTKFRGTVYLHASKWFGKQEVYDNFQDVRDGINPGFCGRSVTIGEMRGLGGHIVGTVEIVDCVKESASPWFSGSYGFVLRNPMPLANPFPFKGALGFFDVPLLSSPAPIEPVNADALEGARKK